MLKPAAAGVNATIVAVAPPDGGTRASAPAKSGAVSLQEPGPILSRVRIEPFQSVATDFAGRPTAQAPAPPVRPLAEAGRTGAGEVWDGAAIPSPNRVFSKRCNRFCRTARRPGARAPARARARRRGRMRLRGRGRGQQGGRIAHFPSQNRAFSIGCAMFCRCSRAAGASGSCDGGRRRGLAPERAAGAEKPLKRSSSRTIDTTRSIAAKFAPVTGSTIASKERSRASFSRSTCRARNSVDGRGAGVWRGSREGSCACAWAKLGMSARDGEPDDAGLPLGPAGRRGRSRHARPVGLPGGRIGGENGRDDSGHWKVPV